MTTDTLKKEFIDTQVARFRERNHGGLGFLHRHHIIFKLIEDTVPKSARILDIGCQEGKMLKELKTRGYSNLAGVDIQEWAKESLKGFGIDYRVCDIEHEPLPFRGTFDAIIMTDVLEHLFSPQTVLYDVRKYLSPKGKIIFSTPNAGWFLNGILLTFFPSKLFVSTAFGPWGHTHQFTFFEFKEIARRLNLKIKTLCGGRLDNFAFRSGIKKILFDVFVFATSPLALRVPSVFSAHIFGVLEKSKKTPDPQARFDVGVE